MPQKYQFLTDFEDAVKGSIVELESEAESTLALIEKGIISLFENTQETSTETNANTEVNSSTDAKTTGEGQTEVEPTAPVAPAPVTPTQAKVEPTVAEKVIAEAVSKYPTPPTPFEDMNPMLYAFCKAIEAHEVCVGPDIDPRYPEGTRAYFDKNPGNLKYRNQTNTIAEDKDGFAVFDTLDHGFQALANQVIFAASGRSPAYKNPIWDTTIKAWRQMNFLDFFKIYDSSYKDDPIAYAKDVAEALGVTVETTLNHFL